MIERLKRWYARLAGFDYRMEEDRPKTERWVDPGYVEPIEFGQLPDQPKKIATPRDGQKPNRGRVK